MCVANVYHIGPGKYSLFFCFIVIVIVNKIFSTACWTLAHHIWQDLQGRQVNLKFSFVPLLHSHERNGLFSILSIIRFDAQIVWGKTCTNLLTSEGKSILFYYFEMDPHYMWAKYLAPWILLNSSDAWPWNTLLKVHIQMQYLIKTDLSNDTWRK